MPPVRVAVPVPDKSITTVAFAAAEKANTTAKDRIAEIIVLFISHPPSSPRLTLSKRDALQLRPSP
jgi:uncharacterized membrane protein